MRRSGSQAMPGEPDLQDRRGRRRRKRSDDAKPAYALAALVAIYYAIGTMVENWDLTVALFASTILAFWIGSVILDAMNVKLWREIRFALGRWGVRHEARRVARRTDRPIRP
jgi:hypothetical protein